MIIKSFGKGDGSGGVFVNGYGLGRGNGVV